MDSCLVNCTQVRYAYFVKNTGNQYHDTLTMNTSGSSGSHSQSSGVSGITQQTATNLQFGSPFEFNTRPSTAVNSYGKYTIPRPANTLNVGEKGGTLFENLEKL